MSLGFRSGSAASKEKGKPGDVAGATEGQKPAGPYELDSSEKSDSDLSEGEEDKEGDVEPTQQDKEVLEHAKKTGTCYSFTRAQLKPCDTLMHTNRWFAIILQ